MAEQSAKDIFLEAVDRPADEQEAYLVEACAGDTRLENRVRRLLEAHHRDSSLLGGAGTTTVPGGDTSATTVTWFEDEYQTGVRIGAYVLREKLGEGGFGTVWLADQEQPVQRRVALKVLNPGMDSREIVARFEAERQALALMDHPCIARIYDAGATDKGRPFIVMELVDGRPITHYCRERGLGTTERLELFLKVCRAIQHAHQKGVIHRDIKPNNVLVAEFDGRSIPKVIDFGIAKAIDQRLTEKTLMTKDGQIIGTPAYMSPEQVGETLDIDTRADVYSLGALLYEILSGSTPFDETTLRGAGLEEVLRTIREVDPPRPSIRLKRSRTVDPNDTATYVLSRQVRGDLDWIVMRCLEKDRGRRYDSADVLANDIARHLRGEPVLAGPPDLGYRFGKFARRNRAALTVAAVIIALLVAGILVSLSQASRARQAEAVAQAEATRAQNQLEQYEAIASFLEGILVGVSPERAQGQDTALLRSVLDGAARRLDSEPSSHPEVEATLRNTLGATYFSVAVYDEAEKHLRKALSIREEVLGDEHLDTLRTLEFLGGLLLRESRYADAEDAIARCVRGRRRLLGDDHPETLAAIANLAASLRFQGRLDDAEKLYREVEEARLRIQGEDHADTAQAISNLAGVLEDQGKHGEATERYRRALEIQVPQLGVMHPNTLAAYHNLASMYADDGRTDEAAKLLENALELKRQVLPEGHPSLLVTMNNLASIHSEAGRIDEAEAMYRSAYAAGVQHLGPLHETTLVLGYQLAGTLKKQDRLEEAEKLLRTTWAGAVKALGEETRITVSAESSLAEVLLDLERPAEALEFARHSADLATTVLARDTSTQGVFRVRHGLVLSALGHDDEAIEVLTAAHGQMAPEKVGRWVARTEDALADLYDCSGQPDEARRWRSR